MYRYLDQPIDMLGNGSRFVLWAMRSWARAAAGSRCPRMAVGGSFVSVGAAAALPDFHAAMASLARSAPKKMLLAPVSARRISGREAILLALWEDEVAKRHDNARAVLRLMVPAAAADRIDEALSAAADHLGHAGLAPDGYTGSRAERRAADGE